VRLQLECESRTASLPAADLRCQLEDAISAQQDLTEQRSSREPKLTDADGQNSVEPSPIIRTKIQKTTGDGRHRIMTTTTIWYFSYLTLRMMTTVGPTAGLMIPYRPSTHRQRGMPVSRRELEIQFRQALMMTVEMDILATVAALACHPLSRHCRTHIHHNVVVHTLPGISCLAV